MKLHAACCLLGLTTLTAQSTGVTLSALTQLQTSVTNGAVVNNATWPAGQLTGFWGFGASGQGTIPAQANVTWSSSSSNNGAVVRLEHLLWNPGSVPTITASVGPHEYLIELTATAAVSADVEITRVDNLAAGASSPTVQLDYDNDGTIDVTNLSSVRFVRQYGAQPFRVRVVVAANLVGAEYASSQLYFVATPQNDLTITEVVANCRPLMPPPPPFVQPSFVGRGIMLTLPGFPSELPLMVVGFSPQPLLLGIQGALPCLLLPAPQIVVFEPSGLLNIPLPAALRPLTFYTQGVTWSNGELITSEGYAVVAY